MVDFPKHCERCGDKLEVFSMSYFNMDTICLACEGDERLAPGYAAAKTAEERALAQGDRHWRGVGLSPADEVFLRARRAARPTQNREGVRWPS